MPKAKVNDIEIEYDTFGDPSSKPLLLVVGLGMQMIVWFKEFCMMLVKRGFYVIRFDNRDVGLSTKFDEAGVPNFTEEVMKLQRGEKISRPYTLEDMADDAVGLLDALKIEKAHICGASMGGSIAQIIAFRHPTRVLSLTSMMSSTGNPNLPQPKAKYLRFQLTPRPTEHEAYIEDFVKRWHIFYGSGFPYPEDEYRELARVLYNRSFYPQGTTRQMIASFAPGNRVPKLGSIKVPTLVIHGSDDHSAPIEGGKETAEVIPGAELLIIEGMGHSLPVETWPQIVDAIAKNADKAYT
ncbi:MAG: alpha/beta fold hydrolase [Promethearchaeota archaeon]